MYSLAWWPTVAATTISTITDLRSRRIPNWLVVPFLLLGIALCGITGGWAGIGAGLEGLAAGAAPMALLYILGGMGMGDVKLCAAIGVWVGPRQMMFVLVFMGLAGGIMAFAWAMWRGLLKEMLTDSGDLMLGVARRGLKPHERLTLKNPAARKLPYAPAIAVGAVLSFFAL